MKNIIDLEKANLQDILDEYEELKLWILSEEKPIEEPKFISTKFYLKDQRKIRLALQCALDYQENMAEEDLKLIKEIHDEMNYLAKL